ncbi:hypothetical protein WICPIJ_007355 [Wickerhamomyces pijperi]|uniref:Uncharacterized protein n=1 Tax=Wickerhamomyces pijperi TaxID=599730 RepID=A0A9P8Q0C4_WICPI|nr:hypothetical protein WICPIJ_007355 [Wickerhamomyces pijperi]
MFLDLNLIQNILVQLVNTIRASIKQTRSYRIDLGLELCDEAGSFLFKLLDIFRVPQEYRHQFISLSQTDPSSSQLISELELIPVLTSLIKLSTSTLWKFNINSNNLKQSLTMSICADSSSLSPDSNTSILTTIKLKQKSETLTNLSLSLYSFNNLKTFISYIFLISTIPNLNT